MVLAKLLVVYLGIGVLLSSASLSPKMLQKKVSVIIVTELGDIEAEIDSTHAPITATNFLRYVDAKLYNGAIFFRTVTLQNQPNDHVKIQVIQAGLAPEREKEAFSPIPLERTSITGLHHEAGMLSMARNGPNTATHSFFICIEDQPELDYGGKRNSDGQGFAAFGRVVKGMDIVRKIQRSSAEGQNLKPPIRILSIRRNLI